MTRAVLAEVCPSVRRGERVERRLRDRDRVGRTAHHHAEAVVEAPDATGDADVEEPETARAVFRGARHRITEITVAPVDEDVAFRCIARELIEGVIGDVPRGDHGPEHARWLELTDQVLDRLRTDRAVADRFLHRLGTAVARDDTVLPPRQACDHVGAHSPKAI